MYEIDALDKLEPLLTLPAIDTGAPLPIVFSTEGSLLLAYLVDGRRAALIEFEAPSAHYFGPPNDEAISGHPLYSRGLRSYASFRVLGSSWIRNLEKMNRVHARHNPAQFSTLQHYIFAFHDSTFECVARDLAYEISGANMNSVGARVSQNLQRLSQSRIELPRQ